MGDNDDHEQQSNTPASTGRLWDSAPETELGGQSSRIRSLQRTLVGAPIRAPGSLASEAQNFVTEKRISDTPSAPPGLRFIPTRYRTNPPPSTASMGAPLAAPAAATIARESVAAVPAATPAEPTEPPSVVPLAVASSTDGEIAQRTSDGDSASLLAAEPELAVVAKSELVTAEQSPTAASPPFIGTQESWPAKGSGAASREAASQAASALAAPLLSERPSVVQVDSVEVGSKSGAGKWLGILAAAAALGAGVWFARQPNDGSLPAAQPVSSVAAILGAPLEPAAAEKAVPDAKPVSASGLPPLALRPARTLKTCDDLMGKPFAAAKNEKLHVSQGLYKKALRSLMRGQAEQAQTIMCHAASWHLGGPATTGLAALLMKAGDYPQALSYAAMVPLSDENERRKTQELIGDIHAQLGAVEPAKAAWLRLFDIDAQDSAAVAEIAARYVKSGKSALGRKNHWLTEQLFRRAVILDPENADAAAGLAAALRKQELNDAALMWAEFAATKNPESAFTTIELLEQLVANKRLDDALKVLDVAEKLAPKQPRVIAIGKRLRKK